MLKLCVAFVLCAFSTAEGYAFDVEQVKNEIFVELAKDLKGNSKDQPTLILVGGYPGAGKTTLINALARSQDIAVISWNAIRQILKDKGQ